MKIFLDKSHKMYLGILLFCKRLLSIYYVVSSGKDVPDIKINSKPIRKT